MRLLRLSAVTGLIVMAAIAACSTFSPGEGSVPIDEAGSPLANRLAGESVDDARAYELVLPEVERLITRIDEYEPLWLSAWEKIAKQIVDVYKSLVEEKQQVLN